MPKKNRRAPVSPGVIKMNTQNSYMKYLFTILLFAYLFCGCATKYPTEWPAKITAENFICNKIYGKYSNPSDLATELQHYGKRTNPTIEYQLDELPNDWPNYFIISFTEKSELKFAFYDQSQKKYKEIIFTKNNEYTCKKDHIKIKGPSGFFLSSADHSECTILLYLAEDGGLIVNSIQKTYLLNEPPGGQYNIWAYFKRINE